MISIPSNMDVVEKDKLPWGWYRVIPSLGPETLAMRIMSFNIITLENIGWILP